jgi:hypothetical protein
MLFGCFCTTYDFYTKFADVGAAASYAQKSCNQYSLSSLESFLVWLTSVVQLKSLVWISYISQVFSSISFHVIHLLKGYIAYFYVTRVTIVEY